LDTGVVAGKRTESCPEFTHLGSVSLVAFAGLARHAAGIIPFPDSLTGEPFGGLLVLLDVRDQCSKVQHASRDFGAAGIRNKVGLHDGLGGIRQRIQNNLTEHSMLREVGHRKLLHDDAAGLDIISDRLEFGGLPVERNSLQASAYSGRRGEQEGQHQSLCVVGLGFGGSHWFSVVWLVAGISASA